MIEGKYQPIVTKEEFKIVQKILERHSVARQEKRGHGCASPIIVEWKLMLMADMIFDIIWNNKKSIIEIANNIIEKTIQNDSLNQFMDEEIMECESNITLNKNKLDRIVDMYCANIIINILKIIVKRNNT